MYVSMYVHVLDCLLCVCVCVFCAWCIMLGEGGGECITLCSEAMYDNRL